MSTISPADAFNYFNSLGYPTESSAAIVGNLFGESGLNTQAIGDNGAAFGIAQWHAPRQANFQNMFGIPITQSTPDQQLAFVNSELQNSYPSVYNTLMGGGSVSDMTAAVMSGYERPANNSSLGKRIAAATSVLSGGGIMSTVQGATDTILNGIFPGAGSIAGGVASIFGIGGGKTWVQQIEEWISNSHFWQRLAIGVLALICIGGAIFLLGNKVIKNAQ